MRSDPLKPLFQCGRRPWGHPRDGGDLLGRGVANALDRTETLQQRPLSFRADPGDVI